ncbi:pantoate--beta-alanine ligase [Bacillus sp. FJAT-42376]|uniref:pantoate--beta-alanine ligase n=1 Tax=Bacillus sp. FJAT-42376 TaxID=2014076 RepID=UPI000F4D4075|nr:pantoate--beta-alanine ligase [Bacillus sp. FJAT-42376]AZB43310.1 pantoate--beta-alanine ligase [Bacillus sp. FJAT-42376]
MIVVKKVSEAKEIVAGWKAENSRSLGFVPTMGYLHEGHLELMRRARKENEKVAVSIFVNPTQFGPNEDFESYPRDIERDLKLAEEAGADLVFTPEPDEMYGHAPYVTLKAAARTDVLCGKSRPGHFDGVVTVLTKLFHIIQPDRAYFGQKDAQQVAVIRGLVDEFFFPLDIVPVNTVREEDGLAKSSRNVFLTEAERKEAPKIYESLQAGYTFAKEANRSAEDIQNHILSLLREIKGAEMDYIEVLQYPELIPVTENSREIIAAAAVKFSGARLIDNLIWKVNDK